MCLFLNDVLPEIYCLSFRKKKNRSPAGNNPEKDSKKIQKTMKLTEKKKGEFS